ncbi:hypothetical protein [Bradyrhizobium sp. AS23.2]|uniref:hypothetical protein n=1 Tax=Bradyrhizobium sp. AS23.2 TaxID=1680155 RepID=UPI00093979BD|nr:hypothetical protein [Bradyrhizobium sp. AS23.2]OKO70117.1 hypothetical protein AC630_35555 [Bradyrhizobium sp. AS23.2]
MAAGKGTAEMKRTVKRRVPVFVETFDHRGTTVRIEEWPTKNGAKIYVAHYTDASGNPCELAPFFSIEACRDSFKKQLDFRA